MPKRRRRADGRLSRQRQAALCRPRRHRLHPRDRARSVAAAAAAAHRSPAGHACPRTSGARTSSGSSRKWSSRPSSAASPMTACCARPPTKGCARTSRRAKWCAKRRRRRRAAQRQAVRKSPQAASNKRGGKSAKPRRHGRQCPSDPSRPGLLARCRRHQAGFGGILRQRVGCHGAARRRPAARHRARSGGHRRRNVLPEAHRLHHQSNRRCAMS